MGSCIEMVGPEKLLGLAELPIKTLDRQCYFLLLLSSNELLLANSTPMISQEIYKNIPDSWILVNLPILDQTGYGQKYRENDDLSGCNTYVVVLCRVLLEWFSLSNLDKNQ